MTGTLKFAAAGFVAAAFFLTAGPMTGAALAAGKHPILSPSEGSTYSAKPLLLRVRTGRHPRAFRAQLNGHSIARFFAGSGKRRVRKLRVTPSHHLKHGRNQLHVRVKGKHGGGGSETTSFHIRRNRPLAAAGLPREVRAGHPIYLDGSRSVSHLGGGGKRPKGLGGTGLDHDWDVVKAPKSAPAGGAGISETDSGRPLLAPPVPGTYRVRHTVTAADGAKGTAVQSVQALYPPFVDIDTMSERSGGKPGIVIGGTPIPADTSTAGGSPWWQVVVLNRKTLTPISNKTYPCVRGSNGFCDDTQLQKDLGALNSLSLVVAANHLTSPNWAPPGYVSFQKIGVPAFRSQDLPASGIASFSAIGVPGDNSGDAHWHIDRAGGSGGAMDGALIVDNLGNYSYLAPRTTFGTQVLGSDDQQNVMRVGEATFTQALALDPGQNGQGGFHVVVLDRQTLQGESHWFGTGHQDFDSGEPGRLNAMTNTLQQANSAGDKLVIIASRGNPATQTGRADQQQNVNDAAKRLVDQIEALGGTRTRAFQSLAPGVKNSGASYTLIGFSNAGTAKGVEDHGTATTPARGLNTVALQGSFARGHDYGFEIADTSPSSPELLGAQPHIPADKLNETLVQEPTPWPDAGKPSMQAAIAFIGKEQFGGDDIRTDYWKSGKDDAFWTQKKTDVGTVKHPGGDPGFTAKELEDAKVQIVQEITWVLAVHAFTRDLAKPFGQNGVGLQSWADLQQIAANVNSNVQAPPSNKATSIASAIFDGARELASEIPVVGEGISAANSIYDTVLEVAKISQEGGEPAGEDFSVEASKVGSELANRLNTAQATLTTQIANAIVADYGKLQTVGDCYLQRSTCPGGAESWKFETADQQNAGIALRYGAEVTDYEALVPAKWTLWQLNDQCPGSVSRTCWEDDFQGDGFYGQVGLFNAPICPFLSSPRSTKLIRPLYRDMPNYRNNYLNPGDPVDIWQTYALGNLTGSGTVTDVYKMQLPGDVLTKLFAAPDPGGDITRGGLGASPESFFLGSMKPKLMARANAGGTPFPYLDSTPFWHGRNTDCVATP